MAVRGAKLPKQMKHIANFCIYLTETFHDQECTPDAGAASSSRLVGALAKDNKAPQKKKKESKKQSGASKKKKTLNKELAALKKKAAQEGAKHLKTVRALKKTQLLERIKKHKEIVKKRMLWIQKNKEKLKKLNAKKKKNTKRDS